MHDIIASRPHMRVSNLSLLARLPAQQKGWRYFVTSLGNGTSYASPSYDDSAWATGQAPFGNLANNAAVGVNAHNYNNQFKATMNTIVAYGARTWIRRNFNIRMMPPHGFHFTGYIDNGMALYVNGVLAFDNYNANAHPYTQDLSRSLFVTGVNSIACRCDDDAGMGSNDAVYHDFFLDPY